MGSGSRTSGEKKEEVEGSAIVHDNRTPVSLILAPSGVRMNKSLDLFKTWFENENKSLIHCDIEKVMLRLYWNELPDGKKKGFVEPKGNGSFEIPSTPPESFKISNIIKSCSRNRVRDYWRKAFAQCVDDLSQGISQAESNDIIAIITGHGIYYHSTLPQFYCPFNIGDIRKLLGNDGSTGLSVSTVVLLIDDIFDMLEHLAKPEAIFSRGGAKGYDARVDERTENYNKSGTEKLEFLRSDIELLSIILKWRLLEMTVAEHIAVELEARFALFSVKQHKSILEMLLRNNKTVYLSHPISSLRRKSEAGESLVTNDLVEGVNRIPGSLQRIACISPTGIDEFRFKKETRRLGIFGPSVIQKDGSLLERWPLLDDVELLLYTLPAELTEWCDIGLEFLTQSMNIKNNRIGVASQISGLENEIRFNVGIRDHLLVAHSDAVLVYRQFYEAERSVGISWEMKHWQYIIAYSHKPTLYALTPKEVFDLVEFIDETEFTRNLFLHIRERINLKSNIPIDTLNVLRNSPINSKHKALGAIDRGDTERIRNAIEELNHIELGRILIPIHCRGAIVPVNSSLIIFQDHNEFQNKLEEIERILLGEIEGPKTNNVLDDFWKKAEEEKVVEILRRNPRASSTRTKKLYDIIDKEIKEWKQRCP